MTLDLKLTIWFFAHVPNRSVKAPTKAIIQATNGGVFFTGTEIKRAGYLRVGRECSTLIKISAILNYLNQNFGHDTLFKLTIWFFARVPNR
jgi:hypothetical protein